MRLFAFVLLCSLLATQCANASEKEQPKKPATPAADSGEKEKKDLPLTPTRTIEFTTDEGTWLSLDVSPDGQTLIFDLVGDFYTLPIAGGEAKKITSGMAFNSQPRYSPDGKLITFVGDRSGAENVWISNVDGSNPQQLSHDEQVEFTSPVFTPDGQYVVVSRESQFPWENYDIWMYHIKGGAGIQVTKGKAKPDAPRRDWVYAVGPSLSRDGHYLYYASRMKGLAYNAQFPLSQIVRRDRITGEEDTITDAPESAFRPEISPDGTKLVYGTRHETETGLRIRDLTTGDEHWLKYPIQRDDQESLYTRDFLPNYAFTPDSKEVIVTWGGKIHRVSVATGEVKDIPFTAKVARQLGPQLNFPTRVDEGPVVARIIQSPAQSPDGKHLAFAALTHIYSMDLPQGTPRRVTSVAAREFEPVWSPDGKTVLYVSTRDSYSSIYRKAWDGTGEEEILFRYTPGAGMVLTDASADGKFVTFYTGVMVLVRLRPEEKALDRKAIDWLREDYDVAGGRFSPDQRLVAYLSNETNVNSNEVYVRPFDASKPDAPPPGKAVQISQNGASGMINWRQDGKELYYLSRYWEVMAVDIPASPTLQVGTPKVLFKLPGPLVGNPRQWKNVSGDGQRFLFAMPAR
jgi:Tol biopolymer transport system component